MKEEEAPPTPVSSNAQKNCCLSNKFRLANNDATGFLYQVSSPFPYVVLDPNMKSQQISLEYDVSFIIMLS